MRHLSYLSLQWITGVFCTVIGTMMLVLPYQFNSPAYDHFRPYLPAWGILFWASGVFLLVVAVLSPGRSLVVAGHVLAGALLLLMALGFALARGWSGTTNYLVIGLAVLLAPFLPGADQRRSPPDQSDLFSLVMALAAVLTGATILAMPEQFRTVNFAPFWSVLPWYGAGYLVGGLVLTAASVYPTTPRRVRLGARLFLGGAFVLWAVNLAIPLKAWTGVAYYGGLGTLLALLPWIQPILDRFDPASLRMRFALTLAFVATIPLIALAAIVTDQEEHLATDQALALQQRIAGELAQHVADYVNLHRAAVSALAAQPGLLAMTPSEQGAFLRSFQKPYPDVVVLITYDAAGNLIVRSDGQPGLPASDLALFQDARATNQPSLEIMVGRTRKRPIFAFGAPIRDANGNFAGFVSLAIESTRLVDVLAHPSISADDRVYMVDEHGRAIAHPDVSLTQSFTDLSQLPPVALLLNSNEDLGSVRYGSPQSERLAGYARVEGLNWGVVAERSVETALAGTHAGRNLIFVMLLLLAVVTLVAGASAANVLTTPLRELAHAINQFAAGDAGFPLPWSNIAEVALLSGAFSDLTAHLTARTLQRDQAEEALKQSEAKFRTFFDSNVVPLIFWHADGRVLDANQAYLDLVRYSREELESGQLRWDTLMAPEYIDPDRQLMDRLVVGQSGSAPTEQAYVLRDGQRVPVLIGGTLLPGYADRGVAFVLDLRERKQAEAALRESEHRLRRLVESNIIGMVDGDASGHITDANDAFLSMVGYTQEDLHAGRVRWRDMTPPEYSYLDDQAIAEARIRGACTPYEKEYITRDGRRVPILIGYALLESSQEEYIAFILDLTELKRTEEKLREQTETVETINRIGRMLSAELDPEKLLQAVTDAATELTGARFGVFFSNTLDAQRPSFRPIALSGISREHVLDVPMPHVTNLLGPVVRGEKVIRLADTKENPLFGTTAPHYGLPPDHLPVTSCLAVPVVSRSGEVLGNLFLGHPDADIFTERHERIVVGLAAQTAIAMDNARLYAQVQFNAETLKQKVEERTRELQEALLQAQSADRAQSTLLSTVTHEMRTPLSSIIGFSSLILNRDPAPDKRREYASVINTEARRLASLISDFLDLQRLEAGREVFRFTDLSLADLIRDIVSKQEPAEHNLHTIRLDIAPAPPVRADGDRIRQVILNLLSNAIKYSPKGGEIVLSLRQEANEVLFSISDQGLGIPAEELGQLFERFHRGDIAEHLRIRGTGLGLTLCKEIIHAHHGRIWATSDGPSQGATFSFTLPII